LDLTGDSKNGKGNSAPLTAAELGRLWSDLPFSP
jgi:hypothetical protein